MTRPLIQINSEVREMNDSEFAEWQQSQVKSEDEIKQECINSTQQRLDSFARTRNYDSILSLCTYATSTILEFKAEGQCGVESRDATWNKLYKILNEVQEGTRPVPSGYSDIEADLPVLSWPA